MNIFTAALLGFVQGITEFLPVSSSAHLVFIQTFIPGFTQDGVVFDMILHVATTLAVIVYFRKRLLSLNLQEIVLLGIATIPAALIGVIFRTQLEGLFSSAFWAGVTLAITGVLNLAIDRARAKKPHVGFLDAVIIGVGQAVAIIPGISRSGATIASGVFRGVSRQKAAEFSFLLSIPAILGATVVEVASHGVNLEGNLVTYGVGALIAAVTAFLSIGFLLNTLSHHRFKYFGYYCIIVGVAVTVLFM